MKTCIGTAIEFVILCCNRCLKVEVTSRQKIAFLWWLLFELNHPIFVSLQFDRGGWRLGSPQQTQGLSGDLLLVNSWLQVCGHQLPGQHCHIHIIWVDGLQSVCYLHGAGKHHFTWEGSPQREGLYPWAFWAACLFRMSNCCHNRVRQEIIFQLALGASCSLGPLAQS